LHKTYEGGHQALKGIDLDIREGEILALLGPNGAGKTTLISTICGLVTPTSGSVTVDGHDIIKDFRRSRELIGLVPQELTLGAFDRVLDSVNFSRGLFGKSPDAKYIASLLADLSLTDKTSNKVQQLSGGMKRRVLIAKALAHEPRILFLDEPTAGVDVELRKDMWRLVERLRQTGVTIILTTHYIEEALNDYELELSDSGISMIYTYDTRSERTGITALLQALNEAGLQLKDLNTSQSSLEDIFVNLVHESSSTNSSDPDKR